MILFIIISVVGIIVLLAQGGVLNLGLGRKSLADDSILADTNVSDDDLFIVNMLLFMQTQSLIYYEIAHEAIDEIENESVREEMRERMKRVGEETDKRLKQ